MKKKIQYLSFFVLALGASCLVFPTYTVFDYARAGCFAFAVLGVAGFMFRIVDAEGECSEALLMASLSLQALLLAGILNTTVATPF